MKRRSIAYLKRSMARGRAYAAWKLGVRLAVPSIFDSRQDQQADIDALMTAHRMGFRQASWDLAELAGESWAKIDLPAQEIAALLLESIVARRCPSAAHILWHGYSRYVSADALRQAFEPLASRSASIAEILQTDLKV